MNELTIVNDQQHLTGADLLRLGWNDPAIGAWAFI